MTVILEASSPVVVRVLELGARAVQAVPAPQWRERGIEGERPVVGFHPEPITLMISSKRGQIH